nr:integrase, catalytic region, zinc finger, CCHC-type, peptidase aspartic, catalytic [Tanacetum cinerariifolium]
MDYQLARDREQHLAYELFRYREDINEVAFVVAAVEKIYAHESLSFNNIVASTVVGNPVTTAMAITEGIYQLKYQDLKDQIGNSPPTPDKDTPDFDSVFVIGKMQASLQGKDNVIRQLKKELSKLQVTHQDTDRALRVQTTDSQITKLTNQVTHLQAQNDLFRAKIDKIKQHYKELYDSIKITHTKHIEQVTKVTTENMNLKTGISKATVNPLVSARDKHAIDVEPIVPRLRNNRNAHLDYLRHLKESVETIRDIVEEAKV